VPFICEARPDFLRDPCGPPQATRLLMSNSSCWMRLQLLRVIPLLVLNSWQLERRNEEPEESVVLLRIHKLGWGSTVRPSGTSKVCALFPTSCLIGGIVLGKSAVRDRSVFYGNVFKALEDMNHSNAERGVGYKWSTPTLKSRCTFCSHLSA